MTSVDPLGTYIRGSMLSLAGQSHAHSTSGLEADHSGVGLLGRRMKIIHAPQLGPLIE